MSNAKQRQQLRRQKRLDEITEAAMQMITDDGIGEFSVNKLADAINLTPGALYRYFDSREMILASVELRVLQEFDDFFAAIDESLGGASPLERVVAFSLGYAALESLRPERFRLISHFISGHDQVLSDDVAAEIVAPTMQIMGRLAHDLEATAEAGTIVAADSTMQRVAVVWSSLHGVMERRKLARFAPDIFDPDELARKLLRALLVGWGAPTADVDAAIEQYGELSFYDNILGGLS